MDTSVPVKSSLLGVLLVLLEFIITNRVWGYEGCTIRYGRRGCYHRILTGVLVTCDGQGMETEVPQNLPQDTVYMSLVNFRFGHLGRVDFERFTTIECLTIQDSGVSGLDMDTFADMQSLHELVLGNTKLNNGHLRFISHPQFSADVLTISDSSTLNTIDINATKTLHQLRTLNLGGNRIESISPGIFAELRHLEQLDLSSNRLSHLEWSWLHEMVKLNQLFLSSNRFQTIPDSMFSVFFAVKELTLANNPLHCNCKLRWLKEFYDIAIDKKMDVADVMCASPSQFSILAASPHQFRCSQPTTPKIAWTLLPDGRFEVNCSSQADPAPTLTFVFPDGRMVITPPSEDLSQVNTTTPQVISYQGQVTCRAENSEGSASTTQDLPLPDSVLNASSRPVLASGLYIWLMTSLAVVCHVLIRTLH